MHFADVDAVVAGGGEVFDPRCGASGSHCAGRHGCGRRDPEKRLARVGEQEEAVMKQLEKVTPWLNRRSRLGVFMWGKPRA